MVREFFVSLGAAAALALASGPALAQQYPTRPVTIVVPFAAGGPTDIVARSMADAMGRSVQGANFVVDNAAGAGGTIGVAKVARAAPDGYTLLVHHIGMATAPALYRKLAFDPLKDFEYVGLINEVAMTLLVKTALPVKDVKELMPYLKQNAAKVSLANAGIGSASHLCGLLFMSAIATDLTTVPYKGAVQYVADLLGGQVDLAVSTVGPALQHVQAGKLVALGGAMKQRISALPDVPSIAEQGFDGFDAKPWNCFVAPAGIPQVALDTLRRALRSVIAEPEVVAALAKAGIEETGMIPTEGIAEAMRADFQLWGEVIRDAKITME